MESNLKDKKLNRVSTFFGFVLIASVCIFSKAGFCEEKSVEVHPEYLKAVKAYADAMIEHGRDVYSEEKTPVFVSGGIDLKTHQFVRKQLKGQGIREGDRAYGSNPHHDLNLYQVL
jgi:hypothetical protein